MWTRIDEDSRQATARRSRDGSFTAPRIFRVFSNEPTTAVAACEAFVGVEGDPGYVRIPKINDAYPDSEILYASAISAAPDASSGRKIFVVTVDYERPNGNTGGGGGDPVEENPLERPDRYAIDFIEGSEPYFLDRSDPPLKSELTNGEVFPQLPERDDTQIRIVVTRNIPPEDYEWDDAILYRNVLNADTVTLRGKTIAPGKLKLRAITAGDLQHENGYDFVEVTFTMDLADKWFHEFESRSFNEKGDGPGGLVSIYKKNVTGQPTERVDVPWPLDADGAALPNATDAPAIITRYPYVAVNFAPLGFE